MLLQDFFPKPTLLHFRYWLWEQRAVAFGYGQTEGIHASGCMQTEGCGALLQVLQIRLAMSHTFLMGTSHALVLGLRCASCQQSSGLACIRNALPALIRPDAVFSQKHNVAGQFPMQAALLFALSKRCIVHVACVDALSMLHVSMHCPCCMCRLLTAMLPAVRSVPHGS